MQPYMGNTHQSYTFSTSVNITGLPRWLSGKESACQFRSHRTIPMRRKWQLTPAFLPGEPHGQRSLAGYSPWGSKELDATERLSTEQINITVTNLVKLSLKG